MVPILTYGAETWTPTKAELKYAHTIHDNTIKRILRTPMSTPTEIIIAETGIIGHRNPESKKTKYCTTTK